MKSEFKLDFNKFIDDENQRVSIKNTYKYIIEDVDEEGNDFNYSIDIREDEIENLDEIVLNTSKKKWLRGCYWSN